MTFGIVVCVAEYVGKFRRQIILAAVFVQLFLFILGQLNSGGVYVYADVGVFGQFEEYFLIPRILFDFVYKRGILTFVKIYASVTCAEGGVYRNCIVLNVTVVAVVCHRIPFCFAYVIFQRLADNRTDFFAVELNFARQSVIIVAVYVSSVGYKNLYRLNIVGIGSKGQYSVIHAEHCADEDDIYYCYISE